MIICLCICKEKVNIRDKPPSFLGYVASIVVISPEPIGGCS